MSFEGPTAQNNVLTHAYQVSQNFHGPESMAFDDWDGTVYVGFGDGTVRTFSSEGIMQNIIFFAGGYLRHGVEGGEDRTQDLLDWCVKESKEGRLAWNHEGEKKCGRPLGIRTVSSNDFKKNNTHNFSMMHHIFQQIIYSFHLALCIEKGY